MAVFSAVAAVGTSIVLGAGFERLRTGFEVIRKQTGFFSDAIHKLEEKMDVVDEQTTAASFRQEILSDGELENEYFTTHVAELIRDGGPWGQHFPEPLFDGEFKLVEQRIVGARHLKCLLGLKGSDVFIDAIAFNIDEDKWPNHRCKMIHCTYRLDINEYRGNRKVQLIIDDLEALP